MNIVRKLRAVAIAFLFTIPTFSHAFGTYEAVHNSVYSTSVSCIFCHEQSSPSSGQPPVNAQIYGVDVRNRIRAVGSSDMNAVIRYLNDIYAPSLSMVDDQSVPASGPYNLQVNPSDSSSSSGVASSVTIPLVFDGGKSNSGRASAPRTKETLTGLTISSASGLAASAARNGNSADLSISLSSGFIRDRSANRSKSYLIQFVPVNGSGFKPVTSEMLNRNKVNVRFQNVPPIGQADTLNAGSPNVDSTSNQWVLNVLVNDDDPDSKIPTGNTVSPPPKLGCVGFASGSAALGTIQANGAGNRILYTLPSPLPAGPTAVTFEYCPIDGENLQGGTITSSILVPGLSSADAPTAVDDRFPGTGTAGPIEDTPFSASVALNDSVPPGGGTPMFSVLTSDTQNKGSVTMAPDGRFTYTSALNYNGDDSFVYQVTNSAGTAQGMVNLTVTPVNDRPTANVVAPIQVNDTVDRLDIDFLDSRYVLDVDGDPLTVTASSLAPIVENFRVPSEIIYDPKTIAVISNNVLTIKPSELKEMDIGDFAEITVNYSVSDGVLTEAQSLTIRINGVDNSIGRTPGLYANSISQRYNNHFKPASQQTGGACLTCHLPGRVGVDVVFKKDCAPTNPVFNAYGLALCLDRTVQQGALTNLPQRMANAEDVFAPELNTPAEALQISESAGVGDPVGAPLTVKDAGKTVGGKDTQIVTYLFSRGKNSPPTQIDTSGNFQISSSGQISVAQGAALTPGRYDVAVLPVNDAGQLNGSGSILRGLPGFFPAENPPVITIFVGAAPVEPQPDVTSTIANLSISIDVLANDKGGSAKSLAIPTAATNGTVTVNGDLTLTYTPNPGFVGTDTFTYTATNSAATTNPTLVTVTVLPEGSVAARDDSAVSLSGISLTISVLKNDLGAVTSGNGLTSITLLSAPDASTVGTISVVGQTLVFTALDSFVGTTTAVYRAQNPSGDPSSATVTIEVLNAGSFTISSAVRDPELRRVARSFEQSCVGATNKEFLDTCVNLTAAALNGEDLENAMRALRNEEHFATVDVAQTMARDLGRGITNRIRNLRNGGVRGFDISGVNVSMSGENIPTQLFSDIIRGTLGLSRDDKLGHSPWGFFVSGDFSFSERDGTSNSDSFDSRAANILVGLDYRPSESRAIGAAIGYTDADTDFSDGGGLDSKAFQASVYGYADSWIAPGIDFDGYVTVGTVSYESDRRIRFQANGVSVDESAQADFDGTYINIVPTFSYVQSLGKYGDALEEVTSGAELRWRIGLDYLRLKTDAYTETGGGGLALNTESETYDSLQLVLGVTASRPIYLSQQVRAEVRGGLTARGELLDDTRYVTSSFTNAGVGAPGFTISEDGTNGIGGTVDLGLSVDLYLGQLDFDYAYDFASDGFSSHALSIGYQKSFSDRSDVSLGVQQNFTDSFDLQGQYNLRF